MKILEVGHTYLVEAYDGGLAQTLTFMKRDGASYPFNHGTHGGTNCQEVLRVVIDRTRYLLTQVPCAETEAILGLLQTALLLFEVRAARRHGGHGVDAPSLLALAAMPTCGTCGHVACGGHDA